MLTLLIQGSSDDCQGMRDPSRVSEGERDAIRTMGPDAGCFGISRDANSKPKTHSTSRCSTRVDLHAGPLARAGSITTQATGAGYSRWSSRRVKPIFSI